MCFRPPVEHQHRLLHWIQLTDIPDPPLVAMYHEGTWRLIGFRDRYAPNDMCYFKYHGPVDCPYGDPAATQGSMAISFDASVLLPVKGDV